MTSSLPTDTFDMERRNVKILLKKHHLELIYTDGFDREAAGLMHKAIIEHSSKRHRTPDPAITEALLAIDLKKYLPLMPTTSSEEKANRTRIRQRCATKDAGLFARARILNTIINGANWKTSLNRRSMKRQDQGRVFGGYLEATFLKVQELAEKRLRESAIGLGTDEAEQLGQDTAMLVEIDGTKVSISDTEKVNTNFLNGKVKAKIDQ